MVAAACPPMALPSEGRPGAGLLVGKGRSRPGCRPLGPGQARPSLLGDRRLRAPAICRLEVSLQAPERKWRPGQAWVGPAGGAGGRVRRPEGMHRRAHAHLQARLGPLGRAGGQVGAPVPGTPLHGGPWEAWLSLRGLSPRSQREVAVSASGAGRRTQGSPSGGRGWFPPVPLGGRLGLGSQELPAHPSLSSPPGKGGRHPALGFLVGLKATPLPGAAPEAWAALDGGGRWSRGLRPRECGVRKGGGGVQPGLRNLWPSFLGAGPRPGIPAVGVPDFRPVWVRGCGRRAQSSRPSRPPGPPGCAPLSARRSEEPHLSPRSRSR